MADRNLSQPVSTLSRGGGQGLLDRPSVVGQAHSKRINPHGLDLGPLRDGAGLPLELEQSAAAPVVGLLGAGGPPTVNRRIGAVVVNAFDLSPDGPFAHVGDESREVCPLRANSDASPTISGIGGIREGFAASPHPQPESEQGVLAPNVQSVSAEIVALRHAQCIANITGGCNAR